MSSPWFLISFFILLLEVPLFSLSFDQVFKPIHPEVLYSLVDSENDEEVEALFRVKEIYNEQKRKKNVIAYSLFWKSISLETPQPLVSVNTINKNSPSIKNNSSFYNTYFKPLAMQIRELNKSYPHFVARVYLANDLEFLIPEFLKCSPTVEIFLMESSSICASPGSMWRFLAFDDMSVAHTLVRDADENLNYMERFIQWINRKSKGLFRFLTIGYCKLTDNTPYSPIGGGSFGGTKLPNFQWEKAMKGFILHRKLFPDSNRHEKDCAYPGHPYGFGNEFPTYGFDERFLKHVVYFEAVKQNLLRTYPLGELVSKQDRVKNNLCTLDLQFCNYHQ